MANMKDIVLAELNEKNEIPDSKQFAIAHEFNDSEFDGILKSLNATEYITLENNVKTEIELIDEGIKAVESGTPEFRLVKLLKPDEEKTRDELGKLLTAKDELKIAVNKAIQLKWITSSKTSVKRIVGEDIIDEAAVKLNDFKKNPDPAAYDKNLINEFKKRKMIAIKQIKHYKITKGPSYKLKQVTAIADLTAQMLSKGTWKEVNFKKLNVSALGKDISTGNFHPLYQMRDEFSSILLELGFEEIPTDHFVETAFWDFDVLFTAQQHPAREMQDTFYLSQPANCTSIPADLCPKVKKAHEGGDYGSIGYRYEWKEEEAKKNIMRTHTTPCSARMLSLLAEETKKTGQFKPKKYFSIDRVFRNEATDATHLFEFHQVEGLVADFNLSLRNLMAIIGEFFKRLGITGLKYKPTYNPYTEPSMEIYGYHPILKKMVEIGNSGEFRPVMLLAFGLPYDLTVLAWGLLLE